MGVPSDRKPSPAWRPGSCARCGPNFEMGKPTDTASLATHPIMGTVTAILIGPPRASSIHSKTPVFEPDTFSKYQSLPVFHTPPRSQLSRVEVLPPTRCAVSPKPGEPLAIP